MKVKWIIILVMALLLAACGAPADSDPAAVFEALDEAWNAKDLDAAMALFAEDAVETNGMGTFTGREAIRGVYSQVMNRFSLDCDNYQVEGDTVTYECVLTMYDGSGKAGEKYVSVVEDGKIKNNMLIGAFTP